jgi:anti-anti-sigma factor
LRLDGVLDRRSVECVRARLVEALDHTSCGHDLVVDISAVTHVDSCGLGVLVAVHSRANRQGKRLVLRAPRPGLVRLLAVTRLGRVLHLAA